TTRCTKATSSSHWEVQEGCMDLMHLSDKAFDPQPIDALGILGIEIDDALAVTLPSLRIPSGVIVATRTERWRSPDLAIAPGDVIHAVNGAAVLTIEGPDEGPAKPRTQTANRTAGRTRWKPCVRHRRARLTSIEW